MGKGGIVSFPCCSGAGKGYLCPLLFLKTLSGRMWHLKIFWDWKKDLDHVWKQFGFALPSSFGKQQDE